MSVSWKHTSFTPSETELARIKSELPRYRNWYFVECLEASDGWADGENHILVKFFSPEGIQTVDGQTIDYYNSQIETFNLCDYMDNPRPQTIEQRLDIAERSIAGLQNLVKELKERLTSLESGV